MRGMLRALRANVDSGGISQGGSTITQQLVKLNLLSTEQTLDRKVQEIVLAQRLEQQMSKQEILNRYVNTVYFGNHAYGIQAAAETYFGVSAGDLDVGQAAFVRLDALPLTRNGKVDRRALPPPEHERMGMAGEYVAPRSPLEQVLAEICADVLKRAASGLSDVLDAFAAFDAFVLAVPKGPKRSMRYCRCWIWLAYAL